MLALFYFKDIPLQSWSTRGDIDKYVHLVVSFQLFFFSLSVQSF